MRTPHPSNGTLRGRVTLDLILGNFQLRMRACHPFKGNPLQGHVPFDDVTSGEKIPMGLILRNFRLRMRAYTYPRKAPLGVT
jgi:hypothetical protein